MLSQTLPLTTSKCPTGTLSKPYKLSSTRVSATAQIDNRNVTFFAAKQLQRGISTAAENVNLIARVRNDLANSFESAPYLDLDNNVLEVPRYTFFLPNFANETEEFRTFVEKDLIESSTLISLEKAGRLNWWCDTLGNSSR